MQRWRVNCFFLFSFFSISETTYLDPTNVKINPERGQINVPRCLPMALWPGSCIRSWECVPSWWTAGERVRAVRVGDMDAARRSRTEGIVGDCRRVQRSSEKMHQADKRKLPARLKQWENRIPSELKEQVTDWPREGKGRSPGDLWFPPFFSGHRYPPYLSVSNAERSGACGVHRNWGFFCKPLIFVFMFFLRFLLEWYWFFVFVSLIYFKI